jgi:hypothetical protein
MSKAKVSSSLVLFLGLSALFLFGQLSPFDRSDPNAQVSPDEMSVMTTVTKTFIIAGEMHACNVLYLYNPTLANATVRFASYYKDGNVYASQTFTVPKKTLVRASSDSITPGYIPWYDTIKLDISVYSAFAKITCPSTLKMTGFIVWQMLGDVPIGNSQQYEPSYGYPRLPIVFF